MATIAVHVPKTGDEKKAQQNADIERFNKLINGEVDEVTIDENKPGTDDEVVISDEDDVIIEDDTPPQDRGREAAPIDSNYDDEDKAIEEELKALQGNKGLAKRIPVVIRQRNDERRAKEQEARARIEATNYARALFERNQVLEKILADTGKLSVDQIKEAAKIKLESARVALRDANESGDSEAITKAQENLQRAVLSEASAANAQPIRLPEMPRPPAQSNLDPKTQSWIGNNQWFTKHKVLTQAALEFSEEALKNRGLTPQDDSYYSYIDEKMKPLLSAYGLAPAPSSGKTDPPRKQSSDNVTPVSRSAAASSPQRKEPSSNKVTVSKAQAELAVQLMPHIPAKEAIRRYALELRKQQS